MDYKELKKKECLFEIINDFADGMDIYRHNGSLWLINTEETKWMIEFTEDKTLWYNYRIFSSLFRGISLDLTENQKYVTEWFESRFLNLHTVKTTNDPFFEQDKYVEDTIKNGVKHTLEISNHRMRDDVEDTIQNGVKETCSLTPGLVSDVEDTIKNGVKDTSSLWRQQAKEVDDTIQNGVKVLRHERGIRPLSVRDTIQNGVKDTKKITITMPWLVEETIQNGVKDTKENWSESRYQVEDTIQNGVKETNGTLRRTLLGVDDIIQNGVKHTEIGWAQDNGVEDTVKNGVKVTKRGLLPRTIKAEYAIQNGVKETYDDVHPHVDLVNGVIKNGVKEIQPLPAQDGNMDWGNYYYGKEDRTKPFNAYLNDAITYGKKIIKNDK